MQSFSGNDGPLFGSISFYDFKPWISKIKNYELAVRGTVFVAGNFPRGEDRIAAYKLGLTFAQRWVNSLLQLDNRVELEKAQTGSSKIKSLLCISETEHTLQQHGLTVLDKYVTKPNLLIAKLLTLNNSFPDLSGICC